MLGTTLNSHYQIVRVLGIGKSGATYLARDLERIDSPLYVLKHIEPSNRDLLPQLAQQQFETQAAIAYQVGKHPQIPTLVAKFEDNGNRYLVREYIEGELLAREFSPDLHWSQTQVFDFLSDLVGILAFVHSHNYIHQDINPHNIIRRHDGHFNLIGFSTAKSTTDRASSNQPNDRHLQDPSYIPYEQERGATRFNSDIYAVGAIAIQAMTGKFPLTRDPKTYELQWKEAVENIDLKLIDIVHKMVRPDYRNRYSSALEVLEDLQAFALAQMPRSKPYLQPRLVAGVAACTLLLGGGVATLLSSGTNSQQLSTNKPAQITDWQKYTDRSAKMALSYAPDWQYQNIQNAVTGEQAMFRTSQQDPNDRYREHVSIRIENLHDPHITLADYTKSAIAEITQYYREAKIIESKSTTLARRPASLVIYTGQDENFLPIQNLEIWTLEGGKAYILTYKAEPDRYQQFLATAMATINSFELK